MARKQVRRSRKVSVKGEYVLEYVNHFENAMRFRFSEVTDEAAVRTAKAFIANEKRDWKSSSDHIKAVKLVRRIPLIEE